MSDTTVKFFDAHLRPPKGGWRFPYKGESVEGYSESELIEKIQKVERNNSKERTEAEISRELWAYFCNREPERCGMMPGAVIVAGPAVPREVTKELQGPPIWGFLNTVAVQWTPDLHNFFQHLCFSIGSILVCPICRVEWMRLNGERSPAPLQSRIEVCLWVNWAHNGVNRRADKPEYPYSRMVAEWGAPSV